MTKRCETQGKNLNRLATSLTTDPQEYFVQFSSKLRKMDPLHTVILLEVQWLTLQVIFVSAGKFQTTGNRQSQYVAERS